MPSSILGQTEESEHSCSQVGSSPDAFEDGASPRDVAGASTRDRTKAQERACKEELHNDSAQGVQGATLWQVAETFKPT